MVFKRQVMILGLATATSFTIIGCGAQVEDSRSAEAADSMALVTATVNGVVESIDKTSSTTSVFFKIINSDYPGMPSFTATVCLSSCSRKVPQGSYGTDVAVGSKVTMTGGFQKTKGKISGYVATSLKTSVEDTTPPTTPTGLTSSNVTYNSLTLAWVASQDEAGGSGLKGYRIYRDGALLKTLGLVTSFADSGLTALTLYHYEVSAIDVAGNESKTTMVDITTKDVPADTTAPSVPMGLTAKAASTSQINLTWLASTDNTGGSGLKSYRIYRGGAMIKEVPTGTLSYSDTGLAASTTYSYAVSAVDNSGNESTKSTSVTAQTSAPTPTVSFKTDVVPIQQKCAGCHGEFDSSTNTLTAVYNELVFRANQNPSVFVLGMKNVFNSTTEQAKLQEWINAGKPNN